MNEWKEVDLGKLVEVKYGKDHKALNTGNIPCLGSGGLMRYVDEYLYNDESILIPRKGSLNNIMYQNNPFWTVDTMFWTIINKELVVPKFLFYQLTLIEYENLNVGSAVPSLTVPVINEIEVKLPSIKTQKSIASILSSFDDKIDLLHSQNATLEKMAETLFRQWFVEEAKEDWENFKLKDLVKHVKPGTNYQPKRIEIGIPFLNVRNLSNGFLDLSDTTKISIEEYQRIHKNWQPEENDLLISRIGTLGIVAVIHRKDLPVAVHYNMINLKAKLTSYQFLYFLLKSQLFQEKYFSNIRQSVQEYVAIEDTENIKIALPIGLEEFKKQEIFFSELYNKIKSNQFQIRTLTALRDTLLPKLMSGEVRLEIINQKTQRYGR